ncbi:MAG TPA: phosphoglycerate mutase family protein [Gemmatimonadaceae bacterium]|nr:phosphoglycerate mutase family protein [Gemmatimonadaceae bacterium]
MRMARCRLPHAFFVLPTAFALACTVAQTSGVSPATALTTVVVVRHAEKSADDPRDPSLTVAGVERANALATVLADAGVTAVYTTQYRRNRQTAAALAQNLGIAVTERPIDATNSASYANDLAREILTRHSGKTVLVVGHSNTVPDIVRALSGRSVAPISDPEYDHIFIVEIAPAGSPRLMHLRYGQPTTAAR